jgi:hypothetical protein
MTVQALGYIGVRSKNLEDWAAYGQNFLGLQRVDKSRQTMAFRMDDRKKWPTPLPSTISPRV